MVVRVARSLDTLLAQLNAKAPGRSKASDGARASSQHTVANPNSDHEPWIKSGGDQIVSARDFTNDPAGGLDCNWLAARLVASGDPRIKYIIWNRRIWTAKDGWVAYRGTNPHDKHLHLSVSSQPGWFDSTLPWAAVSNSGVGSPITTLPAPAPFQEDDMFEAPDREALAEVRRLCAVLLGAQQPANGGEAITVARIRDTAENTAEARRMLAVVLGATAPAAGENRPGSGSSDPGALASAIVTALGVDLAAEVARNLAARLAA